jgi:hypothetical protein
MAEQPIAPASAADVLAIAAHRDDVEQTCGGTLLRMRSLGVSTAILDLTQGEGGTRGSADERAVEAAEAARILAASKIPGRIALRLSPSCAASVLASSFFPIGPPAILTIPPPPRSVMRPVFFPAWRRSKPELPRTAPSRSSTPASMLTSAPASWSTSPRSSRTVTAR